MHKESDLLYAQKQLYEPCGLFIKNLIYEKESADYGAAEFEINGKQIKYRESKITPTKSGQFVTFWKRIDKGSIIPFDLSDSFDFLVVSARAPGHFGQFIFPKNILKDKGVLSDGGQGGKRAIRIYPAWDKADNPQAKKTQIWQLVYFFEENSDINRLRSLLDKN
jgi:hypothetical protein